MEEKIKHKAIQRIYKDMKEIETSPHDGISIAIPDENNPFEMRVNIIIKEGIYKDILLHAIMIIPNDYQLKAPKMILAPGHNFTQKFHNHIFPSDFIKDGYTICIDLLDHGFFENTEKTGWTAAYTLSTILMQMQVFFAYDYDLIELPSQADIDLLRKSSQKYVTSFKLTDGRTQTHSYNKPYPPFQKIKILDNNAEEVKNEEKLNEDQDESNIIKKKKAFEKMTCYMSLCTPEDSSSALGYPLKINIDKNTKKRVFNPILEILSYEGYQQQKNGVNVDEFEEMPFKSAFGENYNFWFPLYINETLFTQNKKQIFEVLENLQPSDAQKKDNFEKKIIMSIFPNLMNKMIVALHKGELHKSIAAIEAYCHFLRLSLRVLDEFPETQNLINNRIDKIFLTNEQRNKQNLGDMGEFLILWSLSKYSLQNENIWKILIVEYISRQIYWVQQLILTDDKIFSELDKKEFKKNASNFFNDLNNEKLAKFYAASKVSNDLLLFNYCANKLLFGDKMAFIKMMTNNFGVVEEKLTINFLEEIKYITKTINTYQDLINFLGLKAIYPTDQDIIKLYKDSIKNAYIQKYSNIKDTGKDAVPDKIVNFKWELDSIEKNLITFKSKDTGNKSKFNDFKNICNVFFKNYCDLNEKNKKLYNTLKKALEEKLLNLKETQNLQKLIIFSSFFNEYHVCSNKYVLFKFIKLLLMRHFEYWVIQRQIKDLNEVYDKLFNEVNVSFIYFFIVMKTIYLYNSYHINDSEYQKIYDQFLVREEIILKAKNEIRDEEKKENKNEIIDKKEQPFKVFLNIFFEKDELVKI